MAYKSTLTPDRKRLADHEVEFTNHRESLERRQGLRPGMRLGIYQLHCELRITAWCCEASGYVGGGGEKDGWMALCPVERVLQFQQGGLAGDRAIQRRLCGPQLSLPSSHSDQEENVARGGGMEDRQQTAAERAVGQT